MDDGQYLNFVWSPLNTFVVYIKSEKSGENPKAFLRYVKLSQTETDIDNIGDFFSEEIELKGTQNASFLSISPFENWLIVGLKGQTETNFLIFNLNDHLFENPSDKF